ncbi:Bug family tripartite tricarboxylate transporter substrate binding protein [Muricoccus radiodurans]|uniref:Bug family tripartite tricarboxylate transporter substrate binding protein n=1 Tax=Muricoccus radiodurans TaxID=2231721 RepID=UPI003CE9E347
MPNGARSNSPSPGRRVLLRGALAAGLLTTRPAAAQESWPRRPVRLVVPFAAGGAADTPARIMADHLTRALGQPCIVENRAGAGGALGIRAVAQATDGHTLLHTTSAVAVLPALQRQPGYDPLTDLAPISLTAEAPILLLVRGEAPWPDFHAYAAAARARPGGVSFGSAGTGSTVHLAGELLRVRAGLDLLHVPFRGSSPAATALLGGIIDSVFLSPLEAMPHLRAGKMRVLGSAGPAPDPLMPDVPRLADFVPSYEGVTLWFGLLGPRDLSEVAIRALMQALAPLREHSILTDRMAELGATVRLDGPAPLTARLRQEVPLWQSLAEAAHIPRE